MELLCYYYGMKPYEFWNCTFREVKMYAQANSSRDLDDFKKRITIQEETSSKLLVGSPLSNKNPKFISLYDTFKNIFNKKKDEDF